MDEYTIDGYSCPDFIQFYAGQEGEIDVNFKQLFKTIDAKLNGKNTKVSTLFDDSLNSVNRAKDFDDLTYDQTKIQSRYICVLALGETSRAMNGEPQNRSVSFEESKLYWIYDFYIKLIDLETNTLLLTRKLNVRSERLFDKWNNKFVKAIGKELEII